MTNRLFTRRAPAAIACAALGLVPAACGGDDGGSGGAGGLDDVAAQALVVDVVGGLDLPGEVRSIHLDAPAGELLFGFHCPIRAAHLDIDQVLVGFPTPRSTVRELDDGGAEAIDVAGLVFDTPASASRVLAAYGAEANASCFGAYFGAPATVDALGSLELGDLTAEGFSISAPSTTEVPGSPSSWAVAVGRVLLDVTVFAPDAARGRELAEPILHDSVDALRDGGA